jgi:hypothetical protein
MDAGPNWFVRMGRVKSPRYRPDLNKATSFGHVRRGQGISTSLAQCSHQNLADPSWMTSCDWVSIVIRMGFFTVKPPPIASCDNHFRDTFGARFGLPCESASTRTHPVPKAT